MKYVIDKYGNVAIGSNCYHFDLSKSVPALVERAGHCVIKDGKMSVFGASAGYGIDAKPEDADILNKALGL